MRKNVQITIISGADVLFFKAFRNIEDISHQEIRNTNDIRDIKYLRDTK